MNLYALKNHAATAVKLHLQLRVKNPKSARMSMNGHTLYRLQYELGLVGFSMVSTGCMVRVRLVLGSGLGFMVRVRLMVFIVHIAPTDRRS